MKKFMSVILAVMLVLGLVACGGAPAPATEGTQATTDALTQAITQATTGAAEDELDAVAAMTFLKAGDGFRVGYARVDITPVKSVPLGGFGNTSMRMSTSILRRIYATCVAVADENDELVLLISLDVQSSAFFKTGRELLAMQLGIPEHHIAVSATHTHAGPDGTNTAEPNIVEWLTVANADMMEAGIRAIADLKPATMSYGSVETENMVFVKHYQNTLADGTVQYFGDNFGTAVYDDTTKHITDADPTMHIVQFEREGGKPVVMANFRGHPLMDGAGSKTQLSSDYPGAFREAVELQYDCEFVFFQGAAGNNNCKTRLNQEHRTSDTAEYGAIMADYVFDCLENNMTQAENTLIQTRNTIYPARCNHDTDSLYQQALVVQSIWTSTNDHAQVKAAGSPYGIRSAYHANAIVARTKRGETLDSELDAIVIGDSVGFVTAPNELYDTLSVMTEEGSPYPMTMTLGYANGYTGYIPSALGWEYTSYESDVSWFAPGTGEEFVDCFLGMLNDMAE